MVLESKSIVCSVWLYRFKFFIPMACVTSTVKWGHVLIWVRIPILVFLSQDLLLLLRSSLGSWLLLLIHHEGCLRWLVLVWVIEIVWSVVCVKRVLSILESALRLEVLIGLHHSILRRPIQIINRLLLLVRERIDRRIYSRLWIFQMVSLILKLLVLTCFHHLRILCKPSWLHKARVLILFERDVLSILKLIDLVKLRQLRCGVVISCEPLVMRHPNIRFLIGLPGCAKLAATELIIKSWHHLLSVQSHFNIWLKPLNFLRRKQVFAQIRENVTEWWLICLVHLFWWIKGAHDFRRLILILYDIWLVEVIPAVVGHGRWMKWLGTSEIVIEDHVVVILLDIFCQSIMFSQEGFEFQRRSIESKFSRFNLLFFKHAFEESSAMTSSLHRFVHVKV